MIRTRRYRYCILLLLPLACIYLFTERTASKRKTLADSASFDLRRQLLRRQLLRSSVGCAAKSNEYRPVFLFSGPNFYGCGTECADGNTTIVITSAHQYNETSSNYYSYCPIAEDDPGTLHRDLQFAFQPFFWMDVAVSLPGQPTQISNVYSGASTIAGHPILTPGGDCHSLITGDLWPLYSGSSEEIARRHWYVATLMLTGRGESGSGYMSNDGSLFIAAKGKQIDEATRISMDRFKKTNNWQFLARRRPAPDYVLEGSALSNDIIRELLVITKACARVMQIYQHIQAEMVIGSDYHLGLIESTYLSLDGEERSAMAKRNQYLWAIEYWSYCRWGIRVKPSRPVGLAQIRYELRGDDLRSAKRRAVEIAQRDANDPDVLNVLAAVFAHEGNYQEAIEALTRAYEGYQRKYPGFSGFEWTALSNMMYCARMAGTAKSVEKYTQAWLSIPVNHNAMIDPLESMAGRLINDGHVDEAESLREKVRQIQSQNANK